MPTIATFIDVNVPVETAYDRWRQFQKSPRLMKDVKQGKQINTYRLHWEVETEGEGVVTFHPISDVMSTVVWQLTYNPEGVVEHDEDGMEASAGRIRKELKRFKAFIESSGQVKGNWLTSLPYHAFF